MIFIVKLVLSLVISYLLIDILMPKYIEVLKKKNINQEVSEYALDEFKNKEKTPIMGGLLFVVVPIIVYLITNFKVIDSRVIAVMLSYFLFCLVGFIDDILIILRHDNKGLDAKIKLLLEFIFVLVIYFLFKDVFTPNIDIPFVNGGLTLPLIIFIPFMVITYLGEANAANFTDGMDGLCAGVSAIGIIFFMIIAYVTKDYTILTFLTCVLGSLIGYLKYNKAPAKIFMGDSGSLALGALFTSVAFVSQKEIALIFIGFVFLWEMLCVCIQQVSVRLFHKRVFNYTPIHYGFVLNGKTQNEVIRLFYIVSVVSGIIGLVLGLL